MPAPTRASVLIESEPRLQSYVLMRFLGAKRYALRSKTLWPRRTFGRDGATPLRQALTSPTSEARRGPPPLCGPPSFCGLPHGGSTVTASGTSTKLFLDPPGPGHWEQDPVHL